MKKFLTDCKYGFNIDETTVCTFPFSSGDYRALADNKKKCLFPDILQDCPDFKFQIYTNGNELGQQKLKV